MKVPGQRQFAQPVDIYRATGMRQRLLLLNGEVTAQLGDQMGTTLGLSELYRTSKQHTDLTRLFGNAAKWKIKI